MSRNIIYQALRAARSIAAIVSIALPLLAAAAPVREGAINIHDPSTLIQCKERYYPKLGLPQPKWAGAGGWPTPADAVAPAK